MKKLLLSLIISLVSLGAFAQGLVHFSNGSPTLISAGGVPMSTNAQYVFAVFLGPSTTVNGVGQSSAFWTDPAFQTVGAYNTNHPNVDGRLVVRVAVNVGLPPASTVDFLVRGWSVNAGGDWATALANWNNGSPLISGAFFGQSVVGDNIILGDGGALSITTLFGPGGSQIPGFDMIQVPEPTSLALLGLGVGTLGFLRRRVA